MSNEHTLYRRWLEQRDEVAFAELARRHAGLVADVAWRVHRDTALAEDALQEALLRLAQDGTERPIEVGLRAWLARAAISLALNARRSNLARKRRETRVASERTEVVMADGDRQLGAQLDEALSRLGGEDAAILALHYRHALPIAELAQVLGVREGAARTRLSRARGRLREQAAGMDLDGARGTAAFAALPVFAISNARVDHAIELATASRPLPVPVTPWFVPSLPVAAAITVVIAVAGLMVWSPWSPESREAANAVGESGEQPAGDRGPTLVGRAPRVRPPVDGHDQPSGRSSKSSSESAADSQPPRSPNPKGTPIKLELTVRKAGEGPIPVQISQVMYQSTTFNGKFLDQFPDLVRVDAGQPIVLHTEDPRAGCSYILARIPDPVPQALTLELPHAEDPAEQRMTIEIVDVEDGRPIPGAWLEWGSRHGSPTRQRADAEGRIRVDFTDRFGHLGPALLAFEQAEKWIHAPGYAGHGRPIGMKEYLPALDADELQKLRERGVHRIALERRDDPEHELRTFRFLHDDGRPATDIAVYIVLPLTDKELREHDLPRRGLRRTDANGEIRVLMPPVVGFDVQVGDDFITAYAAFGQSSPRAIRLPRLRTVDLVVTGMPKDEEVRWSTDPDALLTVFVGKAAFAPKIDERAADWLRAEGRSLAIARRPSRGVLDTPKDWIRCVIPADAGRRIWFSRGEEVRSWTPPEDESRGRVTVKWSDLPLRK